MKEILLYIEAHEIENADMFSSSHSKKPKVVTNTFEITNKSHVDVTIEPIQLTP